MTDIATDEPVHVVARRSPFASERRVLDLPPGQTLAEIVADLRLGDPEHVAVSVNGERIDRAEWGLRRPAGGTFVSAWRRPGFFNFAAALFQYGNIGSLFQAAVSIPGGGTALGYKAADALFSLYGGNHVSEDGGSGSGRRSSIVGETNSLRRWEPVNEVLGRHKIAPDLVARPYSTVEGGKLYFYALYSIGPGDYEVTSVKMAESLIFGDANATISTAAKMTGVGDFDDLELRFWPEFDPSADELELFSEDVQESQVGTRLTHQKGWVEETTEPGATGFTVMIGFAGGLGKVSASGSRIYKHTVRVLVQYRAVGAAESVPWSEATRLKVTAQTRDSVHAARRVDGLAAGQYRVRLKRESEDTGSLTFIDLCDWVSMLTHRAGDPVRRDGMYLIEMRRKIEGEGQRAGDTFSVEAEQKILDWNGSTWAKAPTDNPAAVYRYVLQSQSNRKAVADARLDLASIQAWHEDCTAKGFHFGTVLRNKPTVFALLQNIATVGRASYARTDGLYGVVRDVDHSASSPVTMICPRNSRFIGLRKTFRAPPDAMKVQFTDPSQGWLDTERVVPRVVAPGQTEKEAIAACVTFERLDMNGVIDAEHAWRLGRFELARRTLRPEQYEVEMDFEQLDCLRMELVRFAHDVSFHGVAWARVKSVTTNGGGEVTSIFVDSPFSMEALGSYAIRVRKSDGTQIVAAVDTVAGEQLTVTPTTPIAAASPQVGPKDLVVFGEAGAESVRMVIDQITPGPNLSARVVLVDEAPGIHTAVTGPIPSFDPQITIPPVVPPPTPTPIRIRKGSPVSGTGRGRIKVVLAGSGVTAE